MEGFWFCANAWNAFTWTNIPHRSLSLRKLFEKFSLSRVSQVFDKVWHTGLVAKNKNTAPHPYFHILKSYLAESYFQVKYLEGRMELYPILSGVPQGSVHGLISYQRHIADLPTNPNAIASLTIQPFWPHQNPTLAHSTSKIIWINSNLGS